MWQPSMLQKLRIILTTTSDLINTATSCVERVCVAVVTGKSSVMGKIGLWQFPTKELVVREPVMTVDLDSTKNPGEWAMLGQISVSYMIKHRCISRLLLE